PPPPRDPPGKLGDAVAPRQDEEGRADRAPLVFDLSADEEERRAGGAEPPRQESGERRREPGGPPHRGAPGSDARGRGPGRRLKEQDGRRDQRKRDDRLLLRRARETGQHPAPPRASGERGPPRGQEEEHHEGVEQDRGREQHREERRAREPGGEERRGLVRVEPARDPARERDARQRRDQVGQERGGDGRACEAEDRRQQHVEERGLLARIAVEKQVAVRHRERAVEAPVLVGVECDARQERQAQGQADRDDREQERRRPRAPRASGHYSAGVVTGRRSSPSTGGLPPRTLLTLRSTSGDSARSAPAVHFSRGRWRNASSWKMRSAFSWVILWTSASGTPSRLRASASGDRGQVVSECG